VLGAVLVEGEPPVRASLPWRTLVNSGTFALPVGEGLVPNPWLCNIVDAHKSDEMDGLSI
jgi:hypothetical protein